MTLSVSVKGRGDARAQGDDPIGAILAIERAGETGLERFRLAPPRSARPRPLRGVSLRTRLLGAELAAPVVLVGDCARTATEHGLGLVANELAPDRPPLCLRCATSPTCAATGPSARSPRSRRTVCAAPERDGRSPHARRRRGDRRPRAPARAAARGGPRRRLRIDAADARELRAAGVAAIDVGGPARPGWGIPTADAVSEAVLGAPDLPVWPRSPARSTRRSASRSARPRSRWPPTMSPP